MTNITNLVFNMKSRKIIEISKIILKEKYQKFEKYIYLFYDDKKQYTEEIFKNKKIFGNNTDNANIYTVLKNFPHIIIWEFFITEKIYLIKKQNGTEQRKCLIFYFRRYLHRK